MLLAGNPKAVNAWKSPASSSSTRFHGQTTFAPSPLQSQQPSHCWALAKPSPASAVRSQERNRWSPWYTSTPWAMCSGQTHRVKPSCFTKGRHFTISLSTPRPRLLYNTYSNCSQLKRDRRFDCPEWYRLSSATTKKGSARLFSFQKLLIGHICFCHL